MRLVRVRLSPGKTGEMRNLYREKILPELRLAGCLFAALTESAKLPDECVSLTLWNSWETIADYDHGPFRRLLEEAKPFLAESSEWRVRLSDDQTLTYAPVKEPPKVSSYRVDAARTGKSFKDLETSAGYLRVIRLPIEPERFPGMRTHYAEHVLPTLRRAPGCLYAGLLTNLAMEGQIASMTVWTSRQHAEDYERSELFRDLMRTAREVVGARTWDLMLQNRSPGPDHPEKAVEPATYAVVVGRDLAGER